ncbi:hypothetical protein BpHYR1_042652 [Brachionus plicatilis]|uniref:Uncharacterized protein n=1 Tax=Brachionus plicatilis TaxID=10195 RepID=A0A3M7Q973_BRAPC|nr:hypothetical protein BpHYR1_042652 [Brachionus plicatilis]
MNFERNIFHKNILIESFFPRNYITLKEESSPKGTKANRWASNSSGGGGVYRSNGTKNESQSAAKITTNRLGSNRGNARWDSPATPNNILAESSQERRKQRIERHRLLTLQQYDLSMKNLIINNINDLTETLKLNKMVKKPGAGYPASDNASSNDEDEMEHEVNIKTLSIQSEDDDDDYVVESFEQTYSVVNNHIKEDPFVQSLNLIKSVKGPASPESTSSDSSSSSSLSIANSSSYSSVYQNAGLYSPSRLYRNGEINSKDVAKKTIFLYSGVPDLFFIHQLNG